MKKKGFTQHRSDGTGFTLIELLVAMTIMAVLMGISLVSYQGSRKSARDGKRKADLEQIRSALEIYRTDCKTYPANLTWGSSLPGSNPSGSCSVADTYMEKIPSDPGSCSYYYRRVTANTYVLCTSLETGGTTLGPHCTAPATCGTGCTCNYGLANP